MASPAAGGMGVSTPPVTGDMSALSPGALGFIPEVGTPPGSSLRSMMPDPKISIEVPGPVGGQRPGTGGREVGDAVFLFLQGPEGGRGGAGRLRGKGVGGEGRTNCAECPDGPSLSHDQHMTSDPVIADTTVYAVPGPVCCPHPHPGRLFPVPEDDHGLHDAALH